VRIVFNVGLRMTFAGLVSLLSPTGVSAWNIQEAGLQQHSLQRGEVGAAWFEEYFGSVYAISSIQINPPDTDFEGRRFQAKTF